MPSFSTERPVAHTPEQMFDLVADVDVPLPAAIIAEMLGVPEENSASFARWGREVAAGEPGGRGVLVAVLVVVPGGVVVLGHVQTVRPR